MEELYSVPNSPSENIVLVTVFPNSSRTSSKIFKSVSPSSESSVSLETISSKFILKLKSLSPSPVSIPSLISLISSKYAVLLLKS